jgi:DNA-binding response OmpR family regulator
MVDESFSAAASRLRGLRVLIVEDSWFIAKALQSLLEEVGMVIAGAAASATDAERLACEHAPKLAVVDVKLQDGMAFGLIDRLHDLGVQVVVVSGFATFSTPLVKAAAILQKPFSGEELLAALCATPPIRPIMRKAS